MNEDPCKKYEDKVTKIKLELLGDGPATKRAETLREGDEPPVI